MFPQIPKYKIKVFVVVQKRKYIKGSSKTVNPCMSRKMNKIFKYCTIHL